MPLALASFTTECTGSVILTLYSDVVASSTAEHSFVAKRLVEMLPKAIPSIRLLEERLSP